MEELKTLGTFLAIILLPLLAIFITMIVFQIIGQWKVFKKAGKNGWESIIPYYNTWTLVSISGCKWWYFLIIIGSSFISTNISLNLNDNSILNLNIFDGLGTLINYFVLYSVNYNIAKKFNKDFWYAIGLTLIPFVFYPILGLGKNEFNKDVKVSPYGVIKEGEI